MFISERKAMETYGVTHRFLKQAVAVGAVQIRHTGVNGRVKYLESDVEQLSKNGLPEADTKEAA